MHNTYDGKSLINRPNNTILVGHIKRSKCCLTLRWQLSTKYKQVLNAFVVCLAELKVAVVYSPPHCIHSTGRPPFILQQWHCLYYMYYIMLLILFECLMQIQAALIFATSLICSCLLSRPTSWSGCGSILFINWTFSRKYSILTRARSSRITQPGIVILIMQRTTYTHTCLIGSYTHVEKVLITSHMYCFS